MGACRVSADSIHVRAATATCLNTDSVSPTATFVLSDPSDIARLAEDQILKMANMRNSKLELPHEILDVLLILYCSVA